MLRQWGDQPNGSRKVGSRHRGVGEQEGKMGEDKEQRRERRRWSREIEKAEELKREKCRAAAPNLSMGLPHNVIVREG